MNEMVIDLQVILKRRRKYLRLEKFALERYAAGERWAASRSTCYRKIADAFGQLFLDLGGDLEDLNEVVSAIESGGRNE